MGYSALNPYTRVGSAVSPEARAVTRAASAVLESAENSQALFERQSTGISKLRAMEIECADEGWDGNGAYPINLLALQNAENFIRVLPEAVPLPEYAPEPDGSISLDWIVSRHRLFSVSIGAGNRLAYAWLDGSDTGHGVAHFDGLTVPERVLDGIQSILKQRNVALRPT